MHVTIRSATVRTFTCVLATTLCGAAACAASASAAAAQFEVVASLTGDDGNEFLAPLTQGADGLMYGTAEFGGAFNKGTILRIEADGTVTVLRSFSGSDGSVPIAPLTAAADGWLYGTTELGGTGGMGEIFKVSTAGDFVVLHSFSSGADQGLQAPITPLVPDGDGGFYGAGSLAAKPTAGALFHYSATGQVQVLAQFAGSHEGRGPDALVMGHDGVLYGTTAHGPTKNSAGTFFSYAAGKGLKTLYFFDEATQGTGPSPILVVGPDNAIYGAMRFGGGGGSIFRMTTKGAYTLVHQFSSSDPLGYEPWGGLAIDGAGTLYGTTSTGGKRLSGTVFSMTPKGKGKILQALGPSQSADGYDALAAPTWAADGTLWGLSTRGGTADEGTVFRIEQPR